MLCFRHNFFLVTSPFPVSFCFISLDSLCCCLIGLLGHLPTDCGLYRIGAGPWGLAVWGTDVGWQPAEPARILWGLSGKWHFLANPTTATYRSWPLLFFSFLALRRQNLEVLCFKAYHAVHSLQVGLAAFWERYLNVTPWMQFKCLHTKGEQLLFKKCVVYLKQNTSLQFPWQALLQNWITVINGYIKHKWNISP